MSDVDKYIDAIHDSNLRVLAKKVRRIVRKALPDALESLKWGVPNYSMNGNIVASIGDYSKHLNLYFRQGAKLTSKLLEGSGKGMRHIAIRKPEDIHEKEFTKLLKKAAKIATGN
jgi:hypothetical protein